jgi:hypothetical protein
MEFQDSKLYRRLKYAKHGVFLLVGTGQWGKTVALNSLAQEPLFDDRNIVMINYNPQFVWTLYPERYRAVRWPKKIEDIVQHVHHSKDFIIIDDAVFLAGARDHGTGENKDLQKLMSIASHHELFVGVTIQNTSMLDFMMLQAQDAYVMHKHMDPLSLEFERPELKMRQITANIMLSNYWQKFPDVHPKAFTWCSSTSEMIATKMPTWWKPAMSKAFQGMVPV